MRHVEHLLHRCKDFNPTLYPHGPITPTPLRYGHPPHIRTHWAYSQLEITVCSQKARRLYLSITAEGAGLPGGKSGLKGGGETAPRWSQGFLQWVWARWRQSRAENPLAGRAAV